MIQQYKIFNIGTMYNLQIKHCISCNFSLLNVNTAISDTSKMLSGYKYKAVFPKLLKTKMDPELRTIYHELTQSCFSIGLVFAIEVYQIITQFSKLFQNADQMYHDMLNGTHKFKEIMSSIDLTPLLNIASEEPVTSGPVVAKHFPRYLAALRATVRTKTDGSVEFIWLKYKVSE